ncbi:MAG: PDZ domain-containing protein [Sandaracinaceae bacterium]|nr:PDZ domain-containing protein [Sandaracinaceae bacterium]
MRIWHVLPLVVVVVTGCVYPRRGTSLTSVHPDRVDSGSMSAPPDVWQMTVVEAHVRPRNRGDLDWDDNGGLPDVFVRIYRDEEMVWESETIDDTLEPVWNVTLPRNIEVPHHAAMRFEVWDADTVGGDPVGIYRNHGLPETALPGADSRLLLEGGSYLTIRVENPRPHRGVGVEEYEVRPDELVVIRVQSNSPASRGGLVAGDRIVAIGDQRVSTLGDAQAASALSMSVSRHRNLTVVGDNGRERTVELDSGYVWLSM